MRKVLASANYRTGEAQVNIPYHTVGDLLDPAPKVDLVANGYRPIWLQIRVPENAAPGLYKGKALVVADGLEELAFHFELTVRGRTLPPPAKWAFFLDLWQSPSNVARRYGVEPWSPEHWKALEPLMRELGDSGQKTITVQLQETPRKDASGRWRALILRTKRRDGTWGSTTRSSTNGWRSRNGAGSARRSTATPSRSAGTATTIRTSTRRPAGR